MFSNRESAKRGFGVVRTGLAMVRSCMAAFKARVGRGASGLFGLVNRVPQVAVEPAGERGDVFLGFSELTPTVSLARPPEQLNVPRSRSFARDTKHSDCWIGTPGSASPWMIKVGGRFELR